MKNGAGLAMLLNSGLLIAVPRIGPADATGYQLSSAVLAAIAAR